MQKTLYGNYAVMKIIIIIGLVNNNKIAVIIAVIVNFGLLECILFKYINEFYKFNYVLHVALLVHFAINVSACLLCQRSIVNCS